MLGCHVEDVVNTLVRDGQARYVKWLGIDLAVHGESGKAAEGDRVDVGGRQERFLKILPGARAVVVPGEYARLPAQPRRGEEHDYGSNQPGGAKAHNHQRAAVGRPFQKYPSLDDVSGTLNPPRRDALASANPPTARLESWTCGDVRVLPAKNL